jgi:putative transposase
VLRDFPRLSIERLPPYAPELNPVEQLWNHIKYGELANFTTTDAWVLDDVVTEILIEAKFDPGRLGSFYAGTPLTLPGRTRIT